MITKTLTYATTSTNGPFEYTWTADQSCMNIVQTVFISTDGTFPVTMEAPTEDCFASTILTLQVTDASNCISTVEIAAPLVCDNFTVNPISFTEPFEFTVTASSTECETISFVWSYDTNIFTEVNTISNNNSSILELDLISDVAYPATSLISVTATDCNNCEFTENYTFAICTPVPNNFTVNMYCNESGTGYIDTDVEWLDPTGCIGYVYDWSTLNMTSLPTGLSYSGTGDTGTFSGNSSLVTGIYPISYTVETDKGLTSDIGTISVVAHACNEGQTIYAPDTFSQIECTDLVGDWFRIDIEVYTTASTTIDWTTWTLVQPPISFVPDPPNMIILGPNPSGDPHILYQIPALTGNDTFAWSVCDTNGNCSESSSYTVILDCPAEPIAVNDTGCVNCGDSLILDLAANDLGNGSVLDLTSIALTSAPTLGVVIIVGDGTIHYTPTVGSLGTDSFTYTIANVDGEVSNNGTVDIEITCSGDDGSTITCND